MITFTNSIWWLAVVWALCPAVVLVAQGPAAPGAGASTEQSNAAAPSDEPNAAALAKQTQNPIASLISVPLQSNFDMGLGPRQNTATAVNFQPVIPFALTPSVNVILRVIVPMVSQPLPDGTRIGGIGDTLTSVFFSPSAPGKIIWGLGPAFTLPCATNQAIGSEKFSLGPTAVALIQPGNWTIGALWNHQWSVSGAVDRNNINQDYLQPFASYNLGRGLALTGSIEAAGVLKNAQAWSTVMMFQVSKVTMLRKQPVQLGMAAGPYIFKPTGGPDWKFRFFMTFLFPRGGKG